MCLGVFLHSSAFYSLFHCWLLTRNEWVMNIWAFSQFFDKIGTKQFLFTPNRRSLVKKLTKSFSFNDVIHQLAKHSRCCCNWDIELCALTVDTQAFYWAKTLKNMIAHSDPWFDSNQNFWIHLWLQSLR